MYLFFLHMFTKHFTFHKLLDNIMFHEAKNKTKQTSNPCGTDLFLKTSRFSFFPLAVTLIHLDFIQTRSLISFWPWNLFQLFILLV